MIMTYSKLDFPAGSAAVGDIDLPERNYTLATLPPILRLNPPGHNGKYDIHTFTDICMRQINKELDVRKMRERVALNDLAARHAASVKGETILV